MPTPTYVALAKTVLTTTQTNIDFTSIPSTYNDLVLQISSRGSNSQTYAYVYCQINANTGSVYTSTFLSGDSSTASSSRQSPAQTNIDLGISTGNSATANTFGSIEAYFPSYTSSANKIISTTAANENNSSTAGASYLRTYACLVQDTNPITSIRVIAQSTFASGSRFDLYGIKNS